MPMQPRDGWTPKSHYRDSDDYKPLISEERGNEPPDKHLEAACEEFARRFTCAEDEDEEEADFGSPFLLVANNVRDDWDVPVSFNNHREAKFLRVKGYNKDEATVFIKHFDSPIRRALVAALVGDIDRWIKSNDLTDVITSHGDSGEDNQRLASRKSTS
jgi:hypothetical protein